jgi:hypothetical protein
MGCTCGTCRHGTIDEKAKAKTMNAAPEPDSTDARPGVHSAFWLRGHPWLAASCTLAVMGYSLWPLHSPVRAFRATWYYEFYFLTMLVLGIAAALFVLRVICKPTMFAGSGILRSHLWSWTWIALVIAGGVVAAEDRWPLRAAFWISRAALDEIANQALAAPENTASLAGQRAGLFRVEKVAVIGSTVVLSIDRRDFGFARMPTEVRNVLPNSSSATRWSGDWFVMYDWYWSVKDGWSADGHADWAMQGDASLAAVCD